MTVRHLVPVLVAMLVGLATGCGGSEPASESPPAGGEPSAVPGESDWLSVLTGLGLEADQFKVVIEGSRDGSELVLTITVPEDAPSEYTFGDGLYGAQAFSLAEGTWERVDTADIRTQIAPLLAPGERAELRLPVREADLYRVLVPVESFAAWADIS